MANIQKQPFKGVIPTLKHWLYGSSDYYNDVSYDEQQVYVNASGGADALLRFLSASHIFNRKNLKILVDIGYTNNPAGFGIINKILLAQRNINFIPYWKGKPYYSKKYDLDTNYGLLMLLITGTCIIYEKEVVGFGSKQIVLDTMKIEEIWDGRKFTYRYYNNDGSWIVLDNDKMIFIKIFDPGRQNTQMGLPPFQAALMPIESLREMYVADTSTLKNRGVDTLITNDSDTPIQGMESAEMDEELNKRLSGARRSGRVATSTAKLRAIILGRSTKEMALWDGYKIKLRDICNVLQVDSGQFNDPDNKKFANVTESNKALYTDCVIPFTKLITENKQLIDKLGFEIYLDTSNIDCLQESQNIRAEKAKTTTEAIIGLNEDVKNGTISPEIAVKILVSEWGFDAEEAEEYIMPVQEQAPSPAQPTTE